MSKKYEHSEKARAHHKRTEGRPPVWSSEFTTKDRERKLLKYRTMPSTTVGIDVGQVRMVWKLSLSFPTGVGQQSSINALYGTFPTEKIYFPIFCQRAIGSATAMSISFLVEIKYHVLD